MTKKIYLATTSQSRRNLAQQYGLDWIFVDNELNEENVKQVLKECNFQTACDYTKYLSKCKVLNICEKYDGIIIGCDSVVYQKGRILEKPKNKQQFYEMMTLITTAPHHLITGVTIYDTKSKNIEQFSEISKLIFSPFTNEQKDILLKKGAYSCAGGYTLCDEIQQNTHIIKGSSLNVIGLPIKRILKEIKGLQYE